MATSPGARRARGASCPFAVAGLVIVAAVACSRGGITVLLSADTEGSLEACASCSSAGGLGGMARRATAVAQYRREQPAAVLVDAGNFLFGPDSLESGGRVIVAAYDALGYDAVNLSYRDFRLGKDATLALLGAARFPVVSANLLDARSGRLLAAPYVVRRAGSTRVALLGVTELSVGVADLEHVRAQLEGVRVRPPLEALAEWLPKAWADSDRVVLLFYGSAAGLDEVRRSFWPQLSAILVGGLRPGDLPARTSPPMAATSERGISMASVDVASTGSATVSQLPVDARYARDPGMLDALKTFVGPGSGPLR